ncbi:hypothetical protein V8E54_003671 [Elaphomyces granulatus]
MGVFMPVKRVPTTPDVEGRSVTVGLHAETRSQLAELLFLWPRPNPVATAIRGAISKWDIGDDEGLADLSTTALAILRGAEQEDDPYEVGTLRERTYTCFTKPRRNSWFLVLVNKQLIEPMVGFNGSAFPYIYGVLILSSFLVGQRLRSWMTRKS